MFFTQSQKSSLTLARDVQSAESLLCSLHQGLPDDFVLFIDVQPEPARPVDLDRANITPRAPRHVARCVRGSARFNILSRPG